jgi:signal transduction histidine kinase
LRFGLVLSASRGIMEGHGGQTAPQSKPGRATQVTIALPVLPRLRADGGG